MFYIISFYSDDCPNPECDFLLEEYPEICEGHIRVGESYEGASCMLCELYRVFDENEFIQLITMMQQNMNHIEAFKQVTK